MSPLVVVPEETPRVLTLEEVATAQDEAWLYLEFRKEYAYHRSAYRLAYIARAMLHGEHQRQYYGIRYRCWDKKPGPDDLGKNEWRDQE